jgi:hypothetical protein
LDVAPWGPVDELVIAVGGRDEQLSHAISSLGPATVAEALAAEIRIRGAALAGVGDVVLGLTLEHGSERFPHVVSLKGGQMLLEPGTARDAAAELRYSLLDLVRLLYPHRPGYESTSRDVRVEAWPWTLGGSDDLTPEERTARGSQHLASVFRAVHSVITACSTPVVSLDDLAALYGSDKWGGLHWFTPHYEDHFAAVRYDPVRVLEIGIGGYDHESLGGESLYTWQRFFPRGLVYGLDLYPKPSVVGPRIRTIQGDQNDADFLRGLGEALGPFDIVIDDGSHVNEHVRTSFEALFPYVRPGGHYVIEDLQTSYWPDFGGELPPGSSRTTVGLVKDVLDQIHVREHTDGDDDAPPAPHTSPSDVSVYHNLAFLRKGISHERGIPTWIKQRFGAKARAASQP